VENDADPPKAPKQRKRPQRYDDGSEAHTFASTADYYRKKYFETLDLVQNALSKRFDQEKFSVLRSIEIVLMSACHQEMEKCQDELEEIVAFYKNDFPNAATLRRHLGNLGDLTRKAKVTSMGSLVSFLKDNKSTQMFIAEAWKLVELYLLVPFSTATNERTFSMLRRLKTYLRTTMTSARLNSVAVIHSHAQSLEEADIIRAANNFVSLNSKRKDIFGKF
jgi:hypothetical protein